MEYVQSPPQPQNCSDFDEILSYESTYNNHMGVKVNVCVLMHKCLFCYRTPICNDKSTIGKIKARIGETEVQHI